VAETTDTQKKYRQELKNKRNLLYQMFLKDPRYTRLAIEIKALDDQLAECDQPEISR
jgi:hypothetical protein